LLLATGGSPRRLPFGEGSVIYFRTLNDYQRLRTLTDDGDRFAVIGAGFIGSEIIQFNRVDPLPPTAHLGPTPGQFIRRSIVAEIDCVTSSDGTITGEEDTFPAELRSAQACPDGIGSAPSAQLDR